MGQVEAADATGAAETASANPQVEATGIVRYVPNSSSEPSERMTAEAAKRSSRALLRALLELKRVDEILRDCTVFWDTMDGTVEKLAQMKEHTECLVSFANSSKPLRERFDKRLQDYTDFWASLERLCRQYCSEQK